MRQGKLKDTENGRHRYNCTGLVFVCRANQSYAEAALRSLSSAPDAPLTGFLGRLRPAALLKSRDMGLTFKLEHFVEILEPASILLLLIVLFWNGLQKHYPYFSLYLAFSLVQDTIPLAYGLPLNTNAYAKLFFKFRAHLLDASLPDSS